MSKHLDEYLPPIPFYIDQDYLAWVGGQLVGAKIGIKEEVTCTTTANPDQVIYESQRAIIVFYSVLYCLLITYFHFSFHVKPIGL